MHFEIHNVEQFLPHAGSDEVRAQAIAAHHALVNKSGAGSEFLGWRDLVTAPDDALLADIDNTAREIRAKADVLLCVGIGGSYLGTRAVVDALSPAFGDQKPEIIFAGHHLAPTYLPALFEHLEGRSVYVNVISKSGSTLEPAVAFRFILEWMSERFEDLSERIIVTTDSERGALNDLHRSLKTRKYVIPDDVGGRFSIMSPVGLLPIAVAGNDIRSFLYGAVTAARNLTDTAENSALDYASYRFCLHEAGYKVEALATFDPRLSGIGGWWQQLFGESEGKNSKGLLPITLAYTTDLHSLGQYVQDGQRMIAETFLILPGNDGPKIVESAENSDGLNYLVGKHVGSINRIAYEGTLSAHLKGGVPSATIELDAISTESLGELIYFFEHVVAVSGYMLGVNPFDQPGVEAYKKEMFRLLGRP